MNRATRWVDSLGVMSLSELVTPTSIMGNRPKHAEFVRPRKRQRLPVNGYRLIACRPGSQSTLPSALKI